MRVTSSVFAKVVENDDSDPLGDGYGYRTRLYTVGRAEGLSESCDIPTKVYYCLLIIFYKNVYIYILIRISKSAERDSVWDQMKIGMVFMTTKNDTTSCAYIHYFETASSLHHVTKT